MQIDEHGRELRDVYILRGNSFILERLEYVKNGDEFLLADDCEPALLHRYKATADAVYAKDTCTWGVAAERLA